MQTRLRFIPALLASFAALAFLLLPAPLAAQAYVGKPKLIVIVVIDQFRGDYLNRDQDEFKGRGFNLFMKEGAWFTDCYLRLRQHQDRARPRHHRHRRLHRRPRHRVQRVVGRRRAPRPQSHLGGRRALPAGRSAPRLDPRQSCPERPTDAPNSWWALRR